MVKIKQGYYKMEPTETTTIIERSTKVGNHCPDYDVFVVYDDDDTHASNDIVPKLRSAELRCCTIEENIEPGKITINVFQNLLNRSKKVLFILSKSFILNWNMTLFSSLALKHQMGRIITLVTDGQLLDILASTTIIYEMCTTWWAELLKEIRTIMPEYCYFLDTGNASDLLLIRGLCSRTLRCELFGILMVAADKMFKVNLEEYSAHRNLHHKYGIANACSECSWLNHVDTSVSIAMKKGFLANSDQNLIRHDLVRLCVAVMNTSSPLITASTYRSLTSSVNGQYDHFQQEFISNLFTEARFDLCLESTKKQIDPVFPDFERITARRESYPASLFPEMLLVENLGEAGFYYTGIEDNVQCFFCGLCVLLRDIQENDLDPFNVHAKIRPTCNYIKCKLKLDLDNIDRSFLYGKRQRPSKAFDTVESRKNTFKVIRTEDNNFGIKDENEREELAQRLADAGFYFFGYCTVIGCFHCGISLAFEPTMDPWYIHAILSSKCTFLLQQRGQKFVESIETARRYGMPTDTVVTFTWRVFGSDKKMSSTDPIYRPCSNISLRLKTQNTEL